jgi:lauroyl/myristoyl acyltransferase
VGGRYESSAVPANATLGVILKVNLRNHGTASSFRHIVWRVHETLLAHRAVPFPVMRKLLKERASRKWESSENVRTDARLHMQYLVGKTRRRSETDALAHRYVFMQLQLSALLWRPWLTTRQPVANLGPLLAAQERGRGLILNFVHHGQFDGIFGSLSSYGVRANIAGGPEWFAPDRSRADERLRRNTEVGGARLFNVAESGYRGMAEILRSGCVLALASDMPGHTEMMVLGRRVLGSSGAARLATELRVPIFPIHARQAGSFQYLEVGELIDPSGVADWRQVQGEIARRHEHAILEWPEAMYSPLNRWRPGDPKDMSEFKYGEERLRALTV